MTRKATIACPRHPDHGPGLDPPGELWGRMLVPAPGVPHADLPFEERVDRAWEWIKSARFLPDEHERLEEVLVEMITKKAPVDVLPQEPPK
jgi:hypothetical protein